MEDATKRKPISERLAQVITMGRDKGRLTYDELNNLLPEDVASPEEIDELLTLLGKENIEIVEKPAGGSRLEPQHLQRLWRNTRRYREMLKGLGLDTWGSETPAVPIVLGSKELVYRFWNALLEKGVFTVMSIAPAVPPGKDLIRTAVSALHSDEDLEKIAAAMAYAVKQM